MKHAKGFTLIELVVVIVILGILAATALPNFIDLSGDSKLAKAKAVAGAVASAANVQYAGSLSSTAIAYSTALACGFTYMQNTPSGCSASGTSSCTITCDSVDAPAVSLP